MADSTFDYWNRGEVSPSDLSGTPGAFNFFNRGEPSFVAFESVLAADTAAINFVCGAPTLALAARTFTAAVTFVCPAPTLSIHAKEVFNAALSLVCGAPTFAMASFSFRAAIAFVCPAPTLAAHAVTVSAALAFVCPAPTLAIAAKEVFKAAIALTVGPPTLSLTAVPPIVAAIALHCGAPTLALGAYAFGAAIHLVAGSPTFSMVIVRQPTAAIGFICPQPFLVIFVNISYVSLHTGPLQVTSVTPNLGGSIQSVVIRGSGFIGAQTVMFGPYPYYLSGIADVPVISDTEIDIIAPPSPYYLAGGDHAPLTVDVRVFTVDDPAGSPVNPPGDSYTFIPPPVLYSVVPISGFNDANTPVVIYGKNLQYPISAVDLGPYGADGGDFVSNDDGTQLAGTLVTSDFPGQLADAYELRVANAASFGSLHNPTFSVYPVFSQAPPPVGPLDDVLAGRFGPVAIRYTFEQRDRAYNFIADLTPAVNAASEQQTGSLQGSAGGASSGAAVVHNDNTQPVMATLDLTIGNPELLPLSFTVEDPATFNVAVNAIVTVDSVDYIFPRGLFHLDTPTVVDYASADLPNQVWSCKGADMAYILADRSSPIPYVVPMGSDYFNVIGGICRQFGLVEAISSLGIHLLTPTDLQWPAGTTYLQIVNDLLFGAARYPIQADAQGVMRTRPLNDPALEEPAIGYSTLAEPRMLVSPAARTQSVGTLLNQVSIAIDDPTRDPYTATATNADPSSPASTVQSGKVNFKALVGNAAPSTMAVFNGVYSQVLADWSVRDQAAKAIQRTIETQPDPRRWGREWYVLTIESVETASIWRVVKTDYTCAPGGPHLHTLELCQEIIVSATVGP